MDAAIGNISYRYRAPLRYVFFSAAFFCLGGIAAFFFAVITPWVFRAIILFFMVVAFTGAVGFLVEFLRNLSGQVVFAQDTVILPYRHKRHPVVLEYSGISAVEEKHSYGRLLKITTGAGPSYILDECWMRKGEFDEILEMFREKVAMT